MTDEPVEGPDAAALSVELLQTHGLVHDDLIDDSATRRGGPRPTTPTGSGPGHPGGGCCGLTVLAGDLALTAARAPGLGACGRGASAMVEAQTRAAADDAFVGPDRRPGARLRLRGPGRRGPADDG
ncbi:polyprenyl synthetase family protein [Streptomyces thinghirensis]|nr:polyprenyl synthetase family protein [Streptomyces thinghirensis]